MEKCLKKKKKKKKNFTEDTRLREKHGEKGF